MRYISDDGKVFNTESECVDHENTVKAEQAEKAQFEREKDEMYKYILDEQKKLDKLKEDYFKKYGNKIDLKLIPDLDILRFIYDTPFNNAFRL